MTCIVGLTHEDITYIGCDSLGSSRYSKVVRKDKKAFKLKDTPNAIAGYTSSFRMGQLLMYAKGLIDKRDEPNINHEYIVTKFIPHLINLFKEGGFNRNDKGEDSGGVFLLAYKDKLWKIESDYQVGEAYDNYSACGSGEEYALGSLKTTEDTIEDPVHRIHLALQAASKFSTGVSGPYYIINTNDDTVVEFEC